VLNTDDVITKTSRGAGEDQGPLLECIGQTVKCGPAEMRASGLGLVGFRARDKVRVSVRDRVGVRVSDGVRFSTSYFLSH